MTKEHERGFTLIELSIVLVIIGLIAGGMLVGRSLIAAAAVRAQISQIQKYATATNTFREKYGYLPGDLKDPDGTSFGFIPRGAFGGEGDGNGVLAGVQSNGVGMVSQLYEATGENVTFWVDLSTAKLIEDSFSSASESVPPTSALSTPALINAFFPQAKIGRGNSVFAYSYTAINYFGLSVISSVSTGGWMISNPGITVYEASAIDTKIDDGNPNQGNVHANYVSNGLINSSPAAAPDSATTCYNPSSHTYSVGQNGGSGINCALSFRIQAGD